MERDAAKYAQYRKLTPEEIGALAQRMVDCTDPVEQDELCEEIVRGWYGKGKMPKLLGGTSSIGYWVVRQPAVRRTESW